MRQNRRKPYNWDDFLVLANRLMIPAGEASDHLTSTDGEDAYRSAISRAYYAAFNHAQHAIARNATPRYKDRSIRGLHEQVWDCFGDLKDDKGVLLRVTGLELKESRVSADYHHNDEISKKDAEGVLLRADELIQAIKKLKSS